MRTSDAIQYHALRWTAFGIDFLRAPISDLPEHTHADVQVAIPLLHKDLRASWRTETGRPRTHTLDDRAICIAPAAQPHTLAWQHEAELLWFFLSRAYCEHVAHDLTRGVAAVPRDVHGVPDAFVHGLGIALRAEFTAIAEPTRLYVESVAAVLAVHVLRTYPAHGSAPREPRTTLSRERVQQVREYIATHLTDDLSLDTLAGICYLSPYHFARGFRGATGQTPHAYVIDQRLAQACHLLASTDLPIGMIAAETGFGNQSHLTAWCGRRIGVTPREYRAQAGRAMRKMR